MARRRVEFLSGHLVQSSMASSNSRTTYIQTLMYAEPFLAASMRASFPSTPKLFGPCLPEVNAIWVPAIAAVTHLSA